MIDSRTAKQEVARLAGAALSFAPDKGGADILAKALEKHAKSEKHASVVITRWIESWPQWPKPSELVQLCGNIPDPGQDAARQAREECQRCGGSGWISVEGPYGTSAAYPCSHGPETELDRRQGVRISPALHRHYAALDEAAAPERERWTGSGGKPLARVMAGIMEGV